MHNDKEPVTKVGLLLPGFACTSEIWQLTCAGLEATCTLTCVDWPLQAAPGFHSPADFADWLYASFWPRRCDFLIGHSLGGLVALQLAIAGKVDIPTIILVETFLVPPAPFFQNILLDEASSDPAQAVRGMLEREKACYSPGLRLALREVDLSEQVLRLGKTVHALYGDRGSANPDAVMNALLWTDQLSARVAVTVIPCACHFPMLENPPAVVQALKEIIGP